MSYSAAGAFIPLAEASVGNPDEGLRLARGIAYPAGILFALICAGIFTCTVFARPQTQPK